MIWHFLLTDDDYGRRVGDGIGIKAGDVAQLQPLPNQTLTEEDKRRLANLGNSPSRKLTGQKITGSVRNVRHNLVDGNGEVGNAAGQARDITATAPRH